MVLSAIQADIDFLCGSTSASYPTTAKNRNINIAYSDVARLIWESDGGWQYDDSNSTTLPVAYTSLVHNQKDYTLPSTTQIIQQIEIQSTEGEWFKLKPFDPAEVSVAAQEFQESPGLPTHYDLVGRSIMLYPTPSSAHCTLASGIAVYMNRTVSDLVVASSTPGFASPFHRILSYSAALDFTQDDSARKFLAAQKARMENGLIRFYSKRSEENKTTIKPASKKNWRQYI
jgi:hypothetical protein